MNYDWARGFITGLTIEGMGKDDEVHEALAEVDGAKPTNERLYLQGALSVILRGCDDDGGSVAAVADYLLWERRQGGADVG